MTWDYNGGMMWGSNYGGNWLSMAAMIILALGVVVGLAVFVIRASRPKSNDKAL